MGFAHCSVLTIIYYLLVFLLSKISLLVRILYPQNKWYSTVGFSLVIYYLQAIYVSIYPKQYFSKVTTCRGTCTSIRGLVYLICAGLQRFDNHLYPKSNRDIYSDRAACCIRIRCSDNILMQAVGCSDNSLVVP